MNNANVLCELVVSGECFSTLVALVGPVVIVFGLRMSLHVIAILERLLTR